MVLGTDGSDVNDRFRVILSNRTPTKFDPQCSHRPHAVESQMKDEG